MLGWFKAKFGRKKEEELPAGAAAEQEAPDGLAPGAPSGVASVAEPELKSVAVEPAGEAPAAMPVSHPAAQEEVPAAAGAEDRPVPAAATGKEGKGLFARLQEGLGKTRKSLLYRLDALFLGRKVIDQELYDDLEEILITADLGVNTVHSLLDEVRREVRRNALQDPAALKKILQEKVLSSLQEIDTPAEMVMPESGPFVIMVVGVNGVGKTTTIGKIAAKFVRAGRTVLLVAGDTFRAAAIDQLKIWADRSGVDIVAQKQGADPSSVVFDAMDYGRARNMEVIIIDTAGRLHTQVNLMEELKKIKRVIGKKLEGAPHEVMLVLDATTGQNAVSQARLFNEAVGVTGLTLTKLDGTAKGGIVVNISRELGIPVRFIGIGEQIDDLRDFDPREFVDALFLSGGNAVG
ncbi:MAG TPA: signal recognition particle-docking protein FtsY [Desulfobulbaceae bacterium]|nr:signal recognition particle-docking protein FtsY [Desulfobulbaceae bacterium]